MHAHTLRRSLRQGAARATLHQATGVSVAGQETAMLHSNASAPARRFSPRLGVALFVGVLMAAVTAGPTLARESKTMLQGVTACKAWCDANNQTLSAQHRCYVGCERYWMCNGSDSTTTTCADKPAAVREQGPVTPPPPPSQREGVRGGRAGALLSPR
jgi:hypothetical protein